MIKTERLYSSNGTNQIEKMVMGCLGSSDDLNQIEKMVMLLVICGFMISGKWGLQ